MKKRLLAGLLCGAMIAALSACSSGADTSTDSGAASDFEETAEDAPEPTEFSFYSAVVPEGFEATSNDSVMNRTGGDAFASINVRMGNASADEMLEMELNDEGVEQGEDVTFGDLTWKVAVNEEAMESTYVTDWEESAYTVTFVGVEDQALMEAFLASFVPMEDAYQKWQDRM